MITTTVRHAAWMFTNETAYVLISELNGVKRIADGEPEDSVICGGWPMALMNALQLRRLIVVNPDGTIRRVLHATYSHHAIEASAPDKQPRNRVWFDITDDITAAHLIGQASPIRPVQNPVLYGK